MGKTQDLVSVGELTIEQARLLDIQSPQTRNASAPIEKPRSTSEPWESRHKGADAQFGVGEPTCSLCRGLGYIKYDVDIHDERFGRMYNCPACRADAVKEQAFEAKQERFARYSTVLARQTFETFDIRGRSATVRSAYYGAMQFADEPRGWLILHGDKGTGKTHLSNAVANQRADRHVLAMTVPDLLDTLRSGFDSGDFQELKDLTYQVDLLILDDLGTENSTAWAYEQLFQILNHRYNQILATVISFNGQPEDLDQRIASRMRDRSVCHVYPMFDTDYRPRKEQA